MLDYAGFAELAGCQPSTLRAYAAQGRLCEPDDFVSGRPRWRHETALAWLGGRPGRGRYERRRKEA